LINVAKNQTLNTYKKNCSFVFLILFNFHYNNISGALYSFLTFFDTTNNYLLTFIEKKSKTFKI